MSACVALVSQIEVANHPLTTLRTILQEAGALHAPPFSQALLHDVQISFFAASGQPDKYRAVVRASSFEPADVRQFCKRRSELGLPALGALLNPLIELTSRC